MRANPLDGVVLLGPDFLVGASGHQVPRESH
jgi:hypothetical protein